MYVSKLEKNGFLVFHISNRYLNLEPILARIAKDLGMLAYSREDAPTPAEEELGKTPSHWMVLSRTKEDVARLIDRSMWRESEAEDKTPLWTDDYSNILSAFERG